MLTPSVLIPFAIVALVWSSTWFVIASGLSQVPVLWSIAYRFIVASCGMGLFMRITGKSFRLDRAGWRIAAVMGLAQFMLNFLFVYSAERYLTSGLVAVVFALLIVPNTLLSRLMLKTRVTPAFLAGALVATLGVGLLMAEEFSKAASATSARGIAVGLGFALMAVLSASTANVLQASQAARRQPIYALVGWAMLLGALFDSILALTISGAPVFPHSLNYWAGVAYLGLAGSTLSFPLHYSVIRRVGAGPAAWSSVLVPVIAMLISTALEGYRWTTGAMAGSALVILGLIMALRGRGGRAKATVTVAQGGDEVR